MITGANIAGGNGRNPRVRDDYYATPPEAVKKLLQQHWFSGHKVLEPCAGGGHIARTLQKEMPYAEITTLDITDRGYDLTYQEDFLAWDTDLRFDTIITNPPYSLVNDFVSRCYQLLTNGGQLAMFLKIQFLEGILEL